MFEREKFVGTCIVVENQAVSVATKFRGACFYILSMADEDNDSTGRSLYRMVYCCPLIVETFEIGRRDNVMSSFHSVKEKDDFVFPAVELDCDGTFWVKFGD